jgi:hypothetical protein
MAAYHFRASKNGRVQVNTVNLAQTEWTATWRGEDVDTTNFEGIGAGSGYEQGTIGTQVIDFNSNGLWNAGTNPFGNPPGIYPTDSLPNVAFFQSQSDPCTVAFPLARILSSVVASGNVKTGAIRFNFTGKSNGPFSLGTTGFTITTSSF